MYRVLFYSSFCDFSMIGLIDSLKNNKKIQFDVLLEEHIETGARARIFYNYEWFNYLNNFNSTELSKIANSYDVILVGHHEKKEFLKCVNKNIPLFYMSERCFKEPIKENLLTFIKKEIRFGLKKSKNKSNKYLLTFGSFVYRDIVHNDIGFGNHAFRFSYLTPYYDISYSDLLKNNEVVEIVWIGYAEEKKNIHLLSYLLKKTKKYSNKYHLSIIGGGKEKLPKDILNGNYENCCSIIGEIPFAETQEYLKKASVILTTGYRYEGFNISIQQGMNFGAVPISPIYNGSTLEYITDNKNGYIYWNKHQLVKKFRKLILKNKKRIEMSKNAFETIKIRKNCQIYSDRLVDVIISLLENRNPNVYKDGPLSKAFNLKYLHKHINLITFIKMFLLSKKVNK